MYELQEGQKVLIIRYGKKADCIERHEEVINELGYCWFGKIGVVPSSKVINAILSEDEPRIVLYSQGKGFVAAVEGVEYEKPTLGYPDYYQRELYDELVFPKCYFKITSIRKLSSEEMAKLKIVSSGNSAVETLNSSMSSFFYAEYGKTKLVVAEPKKLKNNKKQVLESNECYYRKNGKCQKKGFVNYEYDCDRPNTCVGQKR